MAPGTDIRKLLVLLGRLNISAMTIMGTFVDADWLRVEPLAVSAVKRHVVRALMTGRRPTGPCAS